MAEELATFQAAVSSTVESVLERSPNEIFHMEVVDELVSKFQRLEERLSRLEWTAMRICDLLLGPPPGQVRLVNRLDEAAG
jgi:hypothetical protein